MICKYIRIINNNKLLFGFQIKKIFESLAVGNKTNKNNKLFAPNEDLGTLF